MFLYHVLSAGLIIDLQEWARNPEDMERLKKTKGIVSLT